MPSATPRFPANEIPSSPAPHAQGTQTQLQQTKIMTTSKTTGRQFATASSPTSDLPAVEPLTVALGNSSAAGGQLVQRALQARAQPSRGISMQQTLAGGTGRGAASRVDHGLGRRGVTFAERCTCALQTAAQGALDETITGGTAEALARTFGCGYVICHESSGARLLGQVGGDTGFGIQRKRRRTIALG